MALTSGRVLARNTIINFLGQCAPLAVALACIPPVVRALGDDRFGVLTLAWATIGYFSLFDFGLGRALTQAVARRLGEGRDGTVPSLIWTTVALMLLLGLLGAAVLALLAPLLVERLLKVPAALQPEALRAFYWLAAATPLVVATAAFGGVLEAKQRFGLLNASRVALGVVTFVGPLAVIPFSRSLVPVIATLVLARLVTALLQLWFCLRVVPELRRGVVLDRTQVGPLLRLGGWMTLSNVISPLMVTLDRFLIGGLVSVSAVTYYATPFEMVTRLFIVPRAVVGVMFPAFAAEHARDPERAGVLHGRSVKLVLLVMLPILLLVILFAREGLQLWVGGEFPVRSTRVVQWLAVGVLANSLAQVPYTLIQGVGRPDITAKLHLIELPLYLTGVTLLIRAYGIEGAAAAWCGRAVLDAALLFAMAWRVVPHGAERGRLVAAIVGGLVLLGLATAPVGLLLRVVLALAVTAAAAVLAWRAVLSGEERSLALGLLRRAPGPEEPPGAAPGSSP